MGMNVTAYRWVILVGIILVGMILEMEPAALLRRPRLGSRRRPGSRRTVLRGIEAAEKRGGRYVVFFPPNASVQRQPDGLTILRKSTSHLS